MGRNSYVDKGRLHEKHALRRKIQSIKQDPSPYVGPNQEHTLHSDCQDNGQTVIHGKQTCNVLLCYFDR
jgi:hypothetical protein